MDPDLALVLGLVLAALSIPSILSAFSDKRAPRASAITILIAGVLIFYAIGQYPAGVPWNKLPDIFMTVVARYGP